MVHTTVAMHRAVAFDMNELMFAVHCAAWQLSRVGEGPDMTITFSKTKGQALIKMVARG